MRVSSQGFFTAPKCGLTPVTPRAISCIFVLPRMTAPASLSFNTASASSAGTLSAKNFEPAVVRTPAVSNKSFSATGMPSSARAFKLDGRRENNASADNAAWTASSGAGVMKALIAGSSRSIWRRQASVRDAAVNSPARSEARAEETVNAAGSMSIKTFKHKEHEGTRRRPLCTLVPFVVKS